MDKIKEVLYETLSCKDVPNLNDNDFWGLIDLMIEKHTTAQTVIHIYYVQKNEKKGFVSLLTSIDSISATHELLKDALKNFEKEVEYAKKRESVKGE